MKKRISISGIVIGALLVLFGIGINIPESQIYGPQEYVGGDAYNYMVESSIRGGKIAGATISKAIYLVGGSIVSLISIFKFVDEKEAEKSLKKKQLESLERHVEPRRQFI